MAKQSETAKGFGRSYTVFYIHDRKARLYLAHIPALDVVTEGRTKEEAREMARDAIEGRLAVLEELGQPIPNDITPERVEV